MCGLLGFSGHKGQKFDKNKIKTLFLYNQDRGKDASGFWSPENGLVKSLDQATKFITKDFKKITEDCMLIGHVRQGTIGKNMITAAHPFEGDKAVLAHNGTLTNYIPLASKYNINSMDYQTDTQALHKIMDSNFNTKILTEIDGSASLLIADKSIKLKKGQENSFLMTFRLNNQRPLFYGMSDEGMYISSLKESLEAIDCTDITEFETGILYTIFEGKIIKELSIPARPYRSYTTNHYGSTTNYGTNVQHTSGASIGYWNKYINNWIKTDRDVPLLDIEKETYYLLKAVNTAKSTLDIVDSNGKEIKDVQTFSFYYNQPIKPLNALSDQFVVVMKKLTDTKDASKVVFHKGDVVKILPRETIDSTGKRTITCVSNIDGEDYTLNSTYARPCETSELSYLNILDTEINKKHNDRLNPKKVSKISPENESFIAQYMIESGLLTTDELDIFIQACDNKEMSALFDIAEDMMISLNDFEDVIEEEGDAMTIVGKKAMNNAIDELKEKTSNLLINAVNSWKTQIL